MKPRITGGSYQNVITGEAEVFFDEMYIGADKELGGTHRGHHKLCPPA